MVFHLFWFERCILARSLHENSLDVDELFDAVVRQLAAISAFLDTAEWQARIGLHRRIHKAGACFYLIGRNFFSFGNILGENGCSQPIDRVVGNLDRFYLVLHWNDGGDRPEQLLVVRRHTLLDVGKNSRRIESAIALRNLTAKQALRAFFNTPLHLIVKFLSQVMPGLRLTVLIVMIFASNIYLVFR